MEACLFCQIRDGSIPSEKVYEDKNTYAFLDIKPVHPGHTLVIPKTHAEDVFATSADDWRFVMETVHHLAPVVKEAAGANGVNIIMNNKRAAGQLVDHAHVHLVPRFLDDGLKGFPQQDSTPEERTAMAKTMVGLLDETT